MIEIDADELAGFWVTIDASPADPTPKLVLADYLAERDETDVQFAVRWATRFGRRPIKRQDIRRRPWTWIRRAKTGSDLLRRLARLNPECEVPAVLFEQTKVSKGFSAVGFTTTRAAYEWLAIALHVLRGDLGLFHAMPGPPP